MEVILRIAKYPRKATQTSVWVVNGAGTRQSIESNDYVTWDSMEQLFCAHPQTSPEVAEIVAAVWRIALSTEEGKALVLKAHEIGL